LIAVTFGIETTGLPFLNHPYGFWVVLGLMAMVMLAMIAYFKKRRWL